MTRIVGRLHRIVLKTLNFILKLMESSLKGFEHRYDSCYSKADSQRHKGPSLLSTGLGSTGHPSLCLHFSPIAGCIFWRFSPTGCPKPPTSELLTPHFPQQSLGWFSWKCFVLTGYFSHCNRITESRAWWGNGPHWQAVSQHQLGLSPKSNNDADQSPNEETYTEIAVSLREVS